MHEQLRKSNSTDEIEKDTKLQDPTSETNFGISESSMLCPVRPLYTIIFDAINRHIGRIGP